MIEVKNSGDNKSLTCPARYLSIAWGSGVCTKINVCDKYLLGATNETATAASAPHTEHTSTIRTKLHDVICILNAPQNTSTTSRTRGVPSSSSASYSTPYRLRHSAG